MIYLSLIFVDMATPKQCSVCKKPTGAYTCTGCEAYFCTKDLRTHREKLANEMEGVIGHRNDLQDKMNKANQEKDSDSPLLSQINEWQKINIEKVKQVADRARQQVIKLQNSKRVEMTSQFDKLSEELSQLKESKDYVEHDLTRLNQAIHQLNQDLNQLSQPSSIKIQVEQNNQIQWDGLLVVEENAIHPGKRKLINYF